MILYEKMESLIINTRRKLRSYIYYIIQYFLIYRCKVMRLEEKLMHQDALCKEKSLECSQLMKDLEEMKNESSRSLCRAKERSESMRRYLHTQISELERLLIQSRAQARACQKERDDVCIFIFSR